MGGVGFSQAIIQKIRGYGLKISVKIPSINN